MGVAGADSAVKKVKCDKGQTLTEALRKAKPGDTLQVTGTCHERVTITTDRLTLDGGGSAVLDGGGGGPTEFEGVVTIDGAHGVTLTGFTIQNGPGEGILGHARRGFCGAAHHRAENAGIRHRRQLMARRPTSPIAPSRAIGFGHRCVYQCDRHPQGRHHHQPEHRQWRRGQSVNRCWKSVGRRCR